MALVTPHVELRRRLKRSWEYRSIKYATIGAMLVLLCLLFAKQGISGASEAGQTSFPSLGLDATRIFRHTLDDGSSDGGDDGDGSCDAYVCLSVVEFVVLLRAEFSSPISPTR